MLTSGEIQATQAALDRIAAERDSLLSQASIPNRIENAFTAIFTGRDDSSTIVGVAARVSAAYDTAKQLRDAAVESPEEAHEEALMIVQLANTVDGTASQIESATSTVGQIEGTAAHISDAVTQATHAISDAAGPLFNDILSGSKWIIVGLVAVAVIALVVVVRR
jgi:methyl-accepting chemotaxis protein